MKESQFQNKVINELKKRNIWYVKYWGGGVFTKEGVPDILACIDGQFHGIELKTDTGTETFLQGYNLDRINHSGGYGYILRPSRTQKNKHDFLYYQLTFEQWLEKFIRRSEY